MPNPPGLRGNRRLASRFPCQLSVRYESRSGWHPATTMDLSLLGCRLRLGERLQRDQKIRVVFECVRSDKMIQAEVPGQVVWSRLEGLSHQVGIRFLKEAPELQTLLSARR